MKNCLAFQLCLPDTKGMDWIETLSLDLLNV